MTLASDLRACPHGTVHCCAGVPTEPSSRVLRGNISSGHGSGIAMPAECSQQDQLPGASTTQCSCCAFETTAKA